MLDYSQIIDVHLEISSLCNATCPLCPRNLYGHPYNNGFPELNLTLENAKKIFPEEFLLQLKTIYINGNYGDIVMNPDGADIVDYFKSVNSNLKITISTNGSARSKDFWQQLAKSGAEVLFCLDGLDDTHKLYRQNTMWDVIIKNAKEFISAGGKATWKMIRFDHNAHQTGQCKILSKQLGFSNFLIINDGRDNGPVFNKQGDLTHVIGNYTGDTDFKTIFFKRKNDDVLLEDIVPDRTPKKTIHCVAKLKRSIYISANGDVSPCCWLGFHPKTYGKGSYHQAANQQISPLMEKYNAVEYNIRDCVAWFNQVENSWRKDTYENGRLVICDDVCGIK